MVMRSREAKYEAALSKAALEMAKSNNDPLYKKYNKHHKLFMEIKQAIISRYKQKARAVVKR
jgi:hypothetical protein